MEIKQLRENVYRYKNRSFDIICRINCVQHSERVHSPTGGVQLMQSLQKINGTIQAIKELDCTTTT
jgi:hypothetical protein